MKLQLQSNDIKLYLQASDVIDFDNTNDHGIINSANELEISSANKLDFIKHTYEWVRDKVSYSGDINGTIVTCNASDVLRIREGICHSKSHLLAALLRCKGIPTGFCYQKLILNDVTAPYLVLHGLVAVYIEDFDRWIRLDARGNKDGIDAQFSIEDEKLAYTLREEKGEKDNLTIYWAPDENVVSSLRNSRDMETLWSNLPRELA